MEDIGQIRLLFVAGLLVMAAVVTLLAYAITRLGDWLQARTRRGRPPPGARRPVPVRGTR